MLRTTNHHLRPPLPGLPSQTVYPSGLNPSVLPQTHVNDSFQPHLANRVHPLDKFVIGKVDVEANSNMLSYDASAPPHGVSADTLMAFQHE